MLPGQHYDPPDGAVLRLGNRVQGKYPTNNLKAQGHRASQIQSRAIEYYFNILAFLEFYFLVIWPKVRQNMPHRLSIGKLSYFVAHT